MKSRISKYLENLFIPRLSEYFENYTILDNSANKNILADWFRHFSPKNKHKQLWHAFSYYEAKAYTGQQAIKRFEKQSKNNIIIFSNELSNSIIFNNLIQNDISIEIINDCINNNKSKHDIYFTEINFAWTFVITHESEFGPYFSFS